MTHTQLTPHGGWWWQSRKRRRQPPWLEAMVVFHGFQPMSTPALIQQHQNMHTHELNIQNTAHQQSCGGRRWFGMTTTNSRLWRWFLLIPYPTNTSTHAHTFKTRVHTEKTHPILATTMVAHGSRKNASNPSHHNSHPEWK